MGNYTKKNLKETEDKAPRFGLDEIQESHFPADELDSESTGIAYQVIHPGKRQGFAHRHENAEEIYVILAGSGKLKLDDEIVDVTALDAIRVAPAVTRQFEAGPEGLQLLAVGPQHKGDGELIHEGFWD
jgi:mannose-6-phosphate isomerase-like protein (cupin superfamily)